eukprot:scaffold2540_cov153-Pinguiococcus_pyrenoidosus.AAC.4
MYRIFGLRSPSKTRTKLEDATNSTCNRLAGAVPVKAHRWLAAANRALEVDLIAKQLDTSDPFYVPGGSAFYSFSFAFRFDVQNERKAYWDRDLRDANGQVLALRSIRGFFNELVPELRREKPDQQPSRDDIANWLGLPLTNGRVTKAYEVWDKYERSGDVDIWAGHEVRKKRPTSPPPPPPPTNTKPKRWTLSRRCRRKKDELTTARGVVKQLEGEYKKALDALRALGDTESFEDVEEEEEEESDRMSVVRPPPKDADEQRRGADGAREGVWRGELGDDSHRRREYRTV